MHPHRAAAFTYVPAPYYVPPPASYVPPPAASAPSSLSFIPPVAANAPLFSFNESAEEPEWNWTRVNLQQLVTEVRARREAGRTP
jgi:hypothetical protein